MAVLKLTDRQAATILAALRYWQENVDEENREEEDPETYFVDTKPLTDAQIDKLCEKIAGVETEDE